MIAFLGGTFDPVHLGHVHAARVVRERLGCEEVRLVLAAVPSHRQPPVASVADRWAMLCLALAGETGLVADDSEMARGEPSYTVETLASARRRWGPDEPLAWIVGWDAYRLLPTWRRWRELLSYGHLVVVRRPGQDAPAEPAMAAFTARHGTEDPGVVGRAPAGRVLLLAADMLPISASEVRARLGRGEPVADLLPTAVWSYISSRQLYGMEGPPPNVTPKSA